jgi:aspartate racemase
VDALENGLRKVGLLGAKMTKEEGFYKARLRERFGIDVLVPDKDERDFIETAILDELCVGKMNASSKKRFKEIINLSRRARRASYWDAPRYRC